MKLNPKILNTALLISVLVVSSLSSSSIDAKRSKKWPKTMTQMAAIADLYFLNQDLDDSTPVLINPSQNCYCACRDDLWACTDLNCELHFDSCESSPTIVIK